jgi:signal transduction histidine kinase
MRLADQLRTTTFLLTLRYMVLFFLSVTILFVFISWSATDYIEQEIDATIQAEVAGLNEQFTQLGPQGLARIIAMRISANPDGNAVYLIADASLNPLLGNISKWPELTSDTNGWVSFEHNEANGDSITVRARIFAPEPDLRLIVGRKVRVLAQLTRLLDRALFWGLGITLALALTGGLMMSNNVLRRVNQFNLTSRRIMDGDLSQRIITAGTGDEFDELAKNLNAMMDQIESLMKNIQHISDNVAHDLRTPLTRLRNRLEDLRQDADSGETDDIDCCIEDAEGLLATFASLLSIARIESGTYEADLNHVNLSQCVRDAYELYKALADEKSIHLSCDAPGEINVRGDRNLLFQAITNLLDNAIKYTPAGGTVSISLQQKPAHIEVSVADSGPGIPADQRDQVLQRFFRLDKSRSEPGAGLGLSLVQAIAQRHGARLELDDNAPGLLIRLIFDDQTDR